jgi:hypothetical protein
MHLSAKSCRPGAASARGPASPSGSSAPFLPRSWRRAAHAFHNSASGAWPRPCPCRNAHAESPQPARTRPDISPVRVVRMCAPTDKDDRLLVVTAKYVAFMAHIPTTHTCAHESAKHAGNQHLALSKFWLQTNPPLSAPMSFKSCVAHGVACCSAGLSCTALSTASSAIFRYVVHLPPQIETRLPRTTSTCHAIVHPYLRSALLLGACLVMEVPSPRAC